MNATALKLQTSMWSTHVVGSGRSHYELKGKGDEKMVAVILFATGYSSSQEDMMICLDIRRYTAGYCLLGGDNLVI